MLTDLDVILFPDDCEVVEIPLHNQHVYLIQKNGSTSLREDAASRGWKVLRNQDLFHLQTIDVYVRDPVQRYLSGVNTFVQHLQRDTPELDRKTCEKICTRYLFLNRHYLPQWHWLVNLARFINPSCRIKLHSFENLGIITDRWSRAGVKPLSMHESKSLLENNEKLEFWFLLDRILLGRCGQSLTWQEILQIYHDHPVQPMSIIQDRMKAVQHALR